ncbi:hypothetical protein [Candidatus Chlamydia sanziniae]|uniref:Inclusion membrane protein A n=1 Tax=Candidatus Chlamydia sanziniae TaxID=1806891 RepID=A0A1A9HW35_9CHLA|nr:hypothetical protein [Candidatus Chlamydia sanziniae]ANH79055.1 Inclusion membrane protein A [Candidatus Chlamydia sanziniae]
MRKNSKYCLILAPGILWIMAGIKLLLKASMSVFDNYFSFIIYCPLAMLAWGLAALKCRFLLCKTWEKQLALANQFISQSISGKTYLRQTFISKRFFIMALMIAFSLILRHYICNPLILFVIRATVGYALIKTAISYLYRIQKISIQHL